MKNLFSGTALLFVFTLLSNFSIAQNLILNPSFELGTPAFNTNISPGSWPQLVGLWEFNNTLSPLTATVGSNLSLVGSHSTTVGYNGSDNAISIGAGSHYNITNPIGANGGGGASYTNQYTLLFDFKIDASSVWRSFFQTSTTNANDGELFCRNTDGMIGVSSYSVEGAIADTWHRLIVSVRNGGGGGGIFDVYLDGRKVLAMGAQSTDGRWSLGNTFKLFADDNGDDGLINVSTVALFNTNLTQTQIENLGRWTSTNWTGMGNYQQQVRNWGYATAFQGNHYCFAGQETNVSAEQIVDVSALASDIDAGSGVFIFNGKIQTYNQGPQDQARVVLEYRNQLNVVLATFDSGNLTTNSVWSAVNNTQNAPIGTRNVRVRLISTRNNGGSNDCYYDDMSLIFTTPLGTDLISFQGDLIGDDVGLTWSIQTEMDCSHYSVQRSDNLTNWVEIARVNVTENNSSLNQYNCLDTNPLMINYYRLLQYNLNGTTEIYGPIAFEFKSNEPLIIVDEGTLNLKNCKNYNQFELFDTSGKLLSKMEIEDEQKIDISTLPEGIYFLTLKSKNNILQKKIFISH